MKRQYSSIGRRIADRRKHKGWSQAELAERTGLTPKYISKIETTKSPSLSISSILKLCAALDVMPNFLMIGAKDVGEKTEYIEIQEKLKLCTDRQLRQVSMHIDAVLSE